MTLAKPSTLLLLLVVATTWQPSIQETAKEGSSVGDLGMDDAPHALLDVQYGNLLISELNQTYTPAQTANAPTVKLRGYLRCGPPFSLLMVDPDAPSRKQPTKPSVSTVHWMVLNANSDEKFHEGDEAVSYRGPKPPRGTGPHRLRVAAGAFFYAENK
ncbi:hypothetical protein MRX96_028730 [Rhipicephalus microplus]